MAAISMEFRESSTTTREKINLSKKTAEPWKRHIIRQLKHRDKSQKAMFQDVIRSYINLLERSNQKAFLTKGILGCVDRYSSSSSTSDSLTLMAAKNDALRKTTGEVGMQNE